jgi:hypothetical protein
MNERDERKAESRTARRIQEEGRKREVKRIAR